MARKTRDVFRDTDTGRFASRSQWESSKGVHYVRERYPTQLGTHRAPKEEIPAEAPEEFPEDYFDSGFEAEEEDEY